MFQHVQLDGFYKDQEVVVIERNTAVEEALYLQGYVQKFILFTDEMNLELKKYYKKEYLKKSPMEKLKFYGIHSLKKFLETKWC